MYGLLAAWFRILRTRTKLLKIMFIGYSQMENIPAEVNG